MEKKKTLYLPYDLIIQILLWLPVRSLVCFKCVCKLWFLLISDPSFTNLHFQITAATHTSRILVVSNRLRKTLSLDFESELNLTEIPHPNFLDPQCDFIFEISYCRGFIFLRHSSKLHLWNPCTGVHKQIPLSPNNELKKDDLCYLYGFGYDQVKDDYLVVVLVSSTVLEDLDDSYSSLEFFSTKDNMWSKIDGSRFPYTQNTGRDNFPTVGSVFNGNIHWLVENEENMDNIILAFDTTERELVEMSYPDNFKLRRDEDCDLCISGEFFSLWAMDYYNGIVEIWVMRDYKVHSSWTKTLVLPIDNIPIPFEYISRICSTKSGNIVLTDDTVLAMYNNKGQLLEYGFLNQSGSSVTAYTESLLSLPSNNVQTSEDVTNNGQDWQIV